MTSRERKSIHLAVLRQIGNNAMVDVDITEAGQCRTEVLAEMERLGMLRSMEVGEGHKMFYVPYSKRPENRPSRPSRWERFKRWVRGGS